MARVELEPFVKRLAAKNFPNAVKRRFGGRRSPTPNSRQPGTDIVPASSEKLGEWGE